ncbi:TPA: NAD-dependent epimerase/dehydratase family protein [Vibrio cholerae]
MSKIFVFGSTGFIGGALVEKLDIYDIDYVTVGRRECDINLSLEDNDFSNLLNVVSGDDYFVFLTSISSPDVCNNETEFAYNINVVYTIKLIRELIDKNVKVVFSSTDLVYGSCDSMVDESTTVSPFGIYANMKHKVESTFSGNKFFKSVRLSYVMGPGDKFTSMLLDCAASGELVEIYNGFERNVVALSDVTEGIMQLVSKWDSFPFGVINFAGPVCISRFDVVQHFKQIKCCKLECAQVNAPESFWDARPKRLNMTSTIFTKLLGKEAKTVEQNLTTWCK